MDPEAAFASLADELRAEPGVADGTGFGSMPGLRAGRTIFTMLVKGELVVKLPAERCGALIEAGGPHDWAALAREALEFVRR